ncbi:MAG: hypothetical protein ACKVPX_03310 [Myxococcaceae bacterium]
MKNFVSVLVMLSAAPVLGSDECHFYASAGGRVSRPSGDCRTDAAGIERCTKDGKVIAELQTKARKREGQGWFLDYNDRKLSYRYRDDEAHGPGQVFSREGNRLCDIPFAENHAEGVVREWHPNGKLASAKPYARGKHTGPVIALTDKGALTRLVCAPKSFTPEDKDPCGFGGKPREVTLHNERGEPTSVVLTHAEGKLEAKTNRDAKGRTVRTRFITPGSESDVDVEILFASGKPALTYSRRAGKESGPSREYAESGQLIREARFDKGEPVEQTSFFLNGKRKEHLLAKDRATVSFKRFWDSGGVKEEGTFLRDSDRADISLEGWGLHRRIGTYRSFWENGKLSEERRFDDKGELNGPLLSFYDSGTPRDEAVYTAGRLTKLKRYDETGKLEKDEEYFEDGSRKLK